MKTIYIDGLGLVEGHFSGIGQYILGILLGLDEILETEKYVGLPSRKIVVIIPRDSVQKFNSFRFKNIHYRRFPLSFRTMSALWHRGKLPPIDLWCGPGTYIFPRFVGMPLLFSKSILVIYDLSYELYRQYSDEGNAVFLSKFTRKSVGKASKIVTISNNASKEIRSFYKLPDTKVSLAYPATDPKEFYRRSQKEIERITYKYGIRGNYILALSNLEPRKNLSALIQSYCELPKAITDEYALLLVGVSGWKIETLFNEIVQKVAEGFNIIRPSEYVSDRDKPAIISGASLLVYPSHYEGFGMPPIEALACGVPVIAANNSSLPEAVGKAGTLVNIEKPGALTNAMIRTLRDMTHVSEITRNAGPHQAARFSWKTSAQIFLNAVGDVES